MSHCYSEEEVLICEKCPIDQALFKEDQTTLGTFPINFLIKEIIEGSVTGPNFCVTHQQKLGFVCLTDKCKVCSHCGIIGDHKGHKMKPVNEFMRDLQEEAKAS